MARVIQDAQYKSGPLQYGRHLGMQKYSWLPQFPFNFIALLDLTGDGSNMASLCKMGQVQFFVTKFDNRRFEEM